MKVSERKISRQMKVSKIAVPNTIKISKEKYFKNNKKQAVRGFLAVEINVLLGRERVNLQRASLKKYRLKWHK